mgnify:CR=1 FL=1
MRQSHKTTLLWLMMALAVVTVYQLIIGSRVKEDQKPRFSAFMKDLETNPAHIKSVKIDGQDYVHERAISTQQTGFSFVSQSRSWLPAPVGGVLWFGVDDTYTTVYVPISCGVQAAPKAFAEGTGNFSEFNWDSAFWAFNFVTNYTAANRTFTYTSPLNRQATTVIDALGRPAQSQTANFNATTFSYDARGRLASATGGIMWKISVQARLSAPMP